MGAQGSSSERKLTLIEGGGNLQVERGSTERRVAKLLLIASMNPFTGAFERVAKIFTRWIERERQRDPR